MMLIAQIDSQFTVFTRKQIDSCIRDAMTRGDTQVVFHYPSQALHQKRNQYLRYWMLYHLQFADELRNDGYTVSVVNRDSLLIEGLT